MRRIKPATLRFFSLLSIPFRFFTSSPSAVLPVTGLVAVLRGPLCIAARIVECAAACRRAAMHCTTLCDLSVSYCRTPRRCRTRMLSSSARMSRISDAYRLHLVSWSRICAESDPSAMCASGASVSDPDESESLASAACEFSRTPSTSRMSGSAARMYCIMEELTRWADLTRRFSSFSAPSWRATVHDLSVSAGPAMCCSGRTKVSMCTIATSQAR